MGAPTLETVYVNKRFSFSTALGARHFIPKAAFVVLLSGVSSIVAGKVKLDLGTHRPLVEHVMSSCRFLLNDFVILLVCLLVPAAVLLDVNSAYFRLTRTGVFYALCALLQWYIGMSCLSFACSRWTLNSLSHFLIGSIIGGLGLKMLPLGAHSFALAKQHMSRPADELLRTSKLDFILYLRSFADDEVVPFEETVRDYDTGKAWSPSFYADQRHRTFEEILCDGLSQIAPVVAFERPGDALPPLGAARMCVGKKDWRSQVDQLMRKCYFAAIVIAKSEGVRWEFEHLIQTTTPNKILLVVPPQPARDEIWKTFKQGLSSVLRLPAVPNNLPSDTLAIAFREDWKPIILAGDREPRAYQGVAQWMQQNQPAQ